jgi:hypothetical protein
LVFCRPSTECISPNNKTKEIWGVLTSEHWVASASLTLEVDDLGQLTPSTTFTTPLTKLTSFGFNGGALLNKSRTRIFNESIDISFNNLDQPKNNPAGQAACTRLAKSNHPYDRAGHNLGFEETVKMAFRSIKNNPTLFTDTDGGGGGGANTGPIQGANTGTSVGAKNTNGFSTTVQFIVTKNLNAVGPTWTLEWIKGPGNLGEIQREDTQKIVMEFSPGSPPSGTPLSTAMPSKQTSKTTAQQHPLLGPEQGAASNNQYHMILRHIDAVAAAVEASSRGF